MRRKLLAIILALLLCQGLVVPALAVVEEIASVRVDEVAGYSQSDGIYTVLQDGLYGFYRADGTELAAPEFAYAEDFQDGMAVVSPEGSGRYGYVDLDGQMAISARYRRAFPFAQDRAFAVRERGSVLVLLNRDGRELASYPDAELLPGERIQFSEGLAVIPVRAASEEDQEPSLAYLVVDLDGQEVFTLTDACVDFENGYHDGRIAVAASGEWVESDYGVAPRFQAEAGAWGYRDVSGELAVDFRYDEAAPFSEGLAGVGLKSGKGRILYGFIDTQGEEILPLEYDGFVSFENGYGAVLQDGLWAYVDNSGGLLTDFRFREVSSFVEDAARVQIGNRRIVMDIDGNELFPVEGAGVLSFSGGVIPAQNEDGLWGIYDKDGSLLVDFEYDRAFHWDGYLWLKRGDLWRVYQTEDVIADRAAAAADPEAEPTAAVGAFSDVPPEAYYAQAVTWATDSDIVTGTGGGQFTPERPCTTGEIIMCLWRAAGQPEPRIRNPFMDVSPSHYYYQAALWAYENGLAAGEIFAAAEPCTRAMVVTYLWSMDGRPYGLTDVFADVPPDAEYAQAVAWALAHGITEGNDGGLFEPDSICSRGQIVTFLYRYMAD